MVQSIEPAEKEIYLPVPGEEDIIVQLTTPAEGVRRSGYAVVLGPGGSTDGYPSKGEKTSEQVHLRVRALIMPSFYCTAVHSRRRKLASPEGHCT